MTVNIGSKHGHPDPLGLMEDDSLPVDILPWFKEYVEKRRRKNMDTYVVCTGREGWGKSSLGLQAALKVHPELDPNDVILDKSDYYRVYNPDAMDGCYVFDEAARLLFNRTWNSKDQIALIQEVMENRQNRNLIMLHLPQFKSLDKYAREGRIDLWFCCTSQGEAMIRKLAYNSYHEVATYPIVVDEHRWLPLETTHPQFAETYYARKSDAHSSAFNERKRDIFQQAKKEEEKREFRSASRESIMAMSDDQQED